MVSATFWGPRGGPAIDKRWGLHPCGSSQDTLGSLTTLGHCSPCPRARRMVPPGVALCDLLPGGRESSEQQPGESDDNVQGLYLSTSCMGQDSLSPPPIMLTGP